LCRGVFSESTEYSDWEPDGINLQPPKRRSQRQIKRRRWSSLDGSESSEDEANDRRHGDDKGKVKAKVDTDDEETGKKSLKKRSTTRSKKKVVATKQKKQVYRFLHIFIIAVAENVFSSLYCRKYIYIFSWATVPCLPCSELCFIVIVLSMSCWTNKVID